MASKEPRNASVQRHVTMPMTKRDSLVLNGSRLSVISSESNNSTNLMERDFIGTHPDTVAGKKRLKKPVKRTDSYKKATNRQSAFDGLSDVKDGHKRERSSLLEGRKKYNTLPLRTDNVITKDLANGECNKRKRDQENKQILRNLSQKSGTYPSPDTDEDQRSVMPERRKKSAFKRVKERLLHTFTRDKQNKHNKNRKDKKYTSRGRVRPNQSETRNGYATPDNVLNNNNNVSSNKDSHNHRTQGKAAILDDRAEKERERRELGLFQQFRNSFRRKERPPCQTDGYTDRTANGSPPHRHDSNVNIHSKSQHDNKATFSNTTNIPQHNHSGTLPIEIPRLSHRSEFDSTEHIDNEADDTISEIFGSIIDPQYPVSPASSRADSGIFQRSDSGVGRPANRTRLRLHGLRICRPGSMDKATTPVCEPSEFEFQSAGSRDHTRTTVKADVHRDLSPTVEIDGLDEADGGQPEFRETDDGFGVVSLEEQQRRIDDVARRLAAIGDRFAADRASGTPSGSEVEGHRVGAGQRQSSLERDIMLDLRAIGDGIDQRWFHENGMNLPVTILGSIKNILLAQDYSSFKRVIGQELTDTMGWQQVAWYTYLTKMAICMSDTDLGKKVKNRTMRYFNTTIKPWVQSKPNGWESIHEETDSELD